MTMTMTNENDMVDSLQYGEPIGKSHHVVLDWTYTVRKSVDEIWESIHNLVCATVDKFVPHRSIKAVQCARRKPVWMSDRVMFKLKRKGISHFKDIKKQEMVKTTLNMLKREMLLKQTLEKQLEITRKKWLNCLKETPRYLQICE